MNFIHHLISDELIYALGWTMLHSLWQGVLVAFLMFIVLYSWRGRSARIRYEMASLSLFGLFVLSLCTFMYFYEGVGEMPLEFILLSHGVPEVVFQQNIFVEYFNQHLPLIVTVWISGVAFFLLRLMGGLLYIQKLKYYYNSPLPEHWQQKLRQLQAKIALRRRVELVESALVKVPMVIGYLKPVILLPVGAINNLSAAEVEAVLAHELAHVTRNDYLINIVLSFIEVLFYYHPAVWLISANIRSERENCADDLAIQLCGNSLTYAKALVSLEELNPAIPAFAMPFSGPKNQLLHRIQRILHQPQNRSNIMEKLTATGLLFVAILLFSISSGNGLSAFAEDIYTETKVLLADDHTFEEAPAFLRAMVAPIDTVPEPKKRNKRTIIQTEDNEVIEIELTGEEVTKLKINGEPIPPEEIANYEDEIAEVIENIPPPPPAPPAPPVAPEPMMPPPPPGAPPAPPAPPHHQRIKIVTSEDGDSHTIIMLDGDKRPTRVDIRGNEGYFVDGESLRVGDSIIILEGYDNAYAYRFDEGDFRIFENFTIDLPDHLYDFSFDWTKELADQLEEMSSHMEHLEVEEQAELRAQLQQQMSDLQAEMEERNEEHQYRVKEQHERVREQARNAMEEAQVLMEEARIQATEAAHEYRERRHGKHERLLHQLRKDGLIESADDYSIHMSSKKLKVNGKKVSPELHQKYLELLGQDDNDNFNMHLEKH